MSSKIEEQQKEHLAELTVLQEEYDEFVVLSKENEEELTRRVQELEKALEERDLELAASKSKVRELTGSMGTSLDELSTSREKVAELTKEKQRLESEEEKREASLRAAEATAARSAELLEAATEDNVLLTTELQEAQRAQRESEARWRREGNELRDQVSVLSSPPSCLKGAIQKSNNAGATSSPPASLAQGVSAAVAAMPKGGGGRVGGGGGGGGLLLTARLLEAFSDLQETSARIQKLENGDEGGGMAEDSNSGVLPSLSSSPSPRRSPPKKKKKQQYQDESLGPSSSTSSPSLVSSSSPPRNYDALFPSPRRRRSSKQDRRESGEAGGDEEETKGDCENRQSNNTTVDSRGDEDGEDNYDRVPNFGTVAFRTTPVPMLTATTTTMPMRGQGGVGSTGDGVAVAVAHGPPQGETVRLRVNDRYGNYRGFVSALGACVSNSGAVLGFVNFEELTAGTADDQLLGTARDQLVGDEVVVEGPLGQVLGSLHLGSGVVRDSVGSVVGEVKRDGEVQSALSSHLGSFSPFTFGDARIVALYTMLIDPGMLSRREEEES